MKEVLKDKLVEEPKKKNGWLIRGEIRNLNTLLSIPDDLESAAEQMEEERRHNDSREE